ncbi:hypothetical protein FYK55_10245 [Roseiconus nitratireducens]|uniref:Uncharacterized protein n=1 Tax=Roseiconus nitratireducens TaxID=2605748 RepID=A0A5M6DAN0_9BACT|nr:hypothetical protein [Roseiconus nitratireducens]KAA5543586.1 hypothetical protein FYK55_10245 [Roseiconus nitratireducens]
MPYLSISDAEKRSSVKAHRIKSLINQGELDGYVGVPGIKGLAIDEGDLPLLRIVLWHLDESPDRQPNDPTEDEIWSMAAELRALRPVEAVA